MCIRDSSSDDAMTAEFSHIPYEVLQKISSRIINEVDVYKRQPLAGIPYALKDNMATEGIATTCASRMLENFVPPYDATVYRQLQQADGVLLGKLNMDEFAMGSSTENSYFKPTRNPRNLDHVPGLSLIHI